MSPSVDYQDVISLIIEIPCLLCMVVMFFSFISKEYQFEAHGFKFWKLTTNKMISFAIILSFILFGLQTTINTIYSIYSMLNESFSAPWCLLSYNEMWWWMIGKLATYQFFIVRLHEIFIDSMFEIKKCKIRAMQIIICVPQIAYSVVVHMNLSKAQQYVSDSSNDWSNIHNFDDCSTIYFQFRSSTYALMQYIGVTIYLLSEIIFCILILRLFLSRIIYLSLSVERVSNDRTSSTSNSSKDSNNDNSDFLELAIKTTNLTILAFLTNYVILFRYGLKLPFAVLNIDGLFNVLSVYLSYSSSSTTYNKLFKPFHNLCYMCCIKFFFCCCLPKSLPNLEDKTIKRAVQSASELPQRPRNMDTTGTTRSTRSTSQISIISTSVDLSCLTLDKIDSNNSTKPKYHPSITQNTTESI